ncbi:hypothetical protein FE257_010984 [Aspergillus nanangensis]|uniref:DH domain-containing protein n=1 Tax=Aspergillus nanangensis TaxID=2582783 RepID=A0AAD4CI18_ASPNN|nr:hypothetical protein FE257_010984 [Aspergillus nanangensis]
MKFQDNSLQEMGLQESRNNVHFQRWVRSFRVKKRDPVRRIVDGWSDSSRSQSDAASDSPNWRLSGLSSNLEEIKTVTTSINSQSIMRSTNTTHSTEPSIRSDVRGSLDSSMAISNRIFDEEAQNRATKRRQVLRELITTESEYVFGLKALNDVLCLLFARPEICYGLQQIRDIHENFLSCIRRVTPLSTLDREEFDTLAFKAGVGTTFDSRLRAIGRKSLLSHRFKAMIHSRVTLLAAETNEALEVALQIQALITKFKVYEDFFRDYQLLTEDVDVLRRSIPNWAVLDQGIEALSRSIASLEIRALRENKAMSLNDLLIKPAQRLCKYPLLLQELLKWTHIQEDPMAYEGIRQALELVRAAISKINDIPGNPVNKTLVQRTLILQNMMVFPKSGYVHDIYKQLGPMSLCGVLHVTYIMSRNITGKYMVCVLFKSHLILASLSQGHPKLQVVACLYVCDVKLDTLRNGRGLCCDSSLFSWKLSFQYKSNGFEVVLSASSANEERKWKTEFLRSIAASSPTPRPVASQFKDYSFLLLDLTPLEANSEGAWRPSIDSRGLLYELNVPHVVIKKTHNPSQPEETYHTEGEIERHRRHSSSALVLTSRRQDRIQLERFIASVYTRESLAYPGMSLSTNDILREPVSLMRRLSRHPVLYRRSSSSSLPRLNSNTTSVMNRPKVVHDSMRKDNNHRYIKLSDSTSGPEDGKSQEFYGPQTTRARKRKAAKTLFSRRSISSQRVKLVNEVSGSERRPRANFSRSSFLGMFNSMPWRRKNPPIFGESVA